jgi:hypothetical protein
LDGTVRAEKRLTPDVRGLILLLACRRGFKNETFLQAVEEKAIFVWNSGSAGCAYFGLRYTGKPALCGGRRCGIRDLYRSIYADFFIPDA